MYCDRKVFFQYRSLKFVPYVQSINYDASSVSCGICFFDMASTGIIQTEDLTKQSPSKIISCLSDKKNEPEQTVISSRNLSNSDAVAPRKSLFNESKLIQEVRIRSLSHWSHVTPSRRSMILAGWFSCNVNDRVICIYCSTICQEWTTDDDPSEVHVRLAPQCAFVLSNLSKQHSPKINNDIVNQKFEPYHLSMASLPNREATFSNAAWTEDSPRVDDLVRAGFFFTGVPNTVTCFYCNGSLHKWGQNDNPIIEHARWFPHCTYAKHLCGDQLYRKIQATKKRILKANKIPENELSRLVAARLDLPVVGQLRLQYSLTIIRRCIEDQLRIKSDDFASDIDWKMACLILQKQIDYIKGCKDKIIVPSRHQRLEVSSAPVKQSLEECLVCLTEEKQLACMPCGHLCACVPCGYALRSCPVCRGKIQSFMRINT